MVFTFRHAFAGAAVIGLAISIGVSPGAQSAQATPGSITATLNTAACPNTAPTLVNGGFETFSNPASDNTVVSGLEGGYVYGLWHGYSSGPDQILFLKPSATPGAGQAANSIAGWRSTSTLIELQRQVGDYANYHDQAGALFTNVGGVTRNGVASATTSGSNANYYNDYAPQAAEGTYWAELNAVSSSALYQDITVPANAQLFWSLKNRGRTNTNEEMKVLIGPASGSLVHQQSLIKYAPTNANLFTGYPSFSSTYTSTTRIIGNLNDGWNTYAGTYAADNTASPGTTRTMRFQFEAISGGNGWFTFGNLIDDIKFTPFLACPVVRNLYVGQTDTVDVSTTSYGLDQSLDVFGNNTAPSSEFVTSGNNISFTPTQVGTYTTDYQVQMSFAGVVYEAASQITYNVSASPIVTYSPEGGTVSRATDVLPMGNSLSTLSFPTPTRTGYSFAGWFTAASNGTEVTPSYASSAIPTADLTLFARWTPVSYPVVYEEQGGTSVPDSTYATSGTVTLATAPTRPGFVFKGWFQQASGGSALGSTFSPSGTGSITLYAQWDAAPSATNNVGTLASTGISLLAGLVGAIAIAGGVFISFRRRASQLRNAN
ncbi:putative repeat protein (TIGR02543 family) [Aurantimicrobium minutum]|uniref:InlB B-repeat-containing protein n=1 Tax=Aurantimicrobium minutum TaxID=708131 RepID=UPI00240677DD|nr:InlB B-repeat-containing protein [Aurantimicrobium minutum]MDF9809868.1 putative repeat protein (TIGR02543 family) [Aurantimicrobium minutum]